MLLVAGSEVEHATGREFAAPSSAAASTGLWSAAAGVCSALLEGLPIPLPPGDLLIGETCSMLSFNSIQYSGVSCPCLQYYFTTIAQTDNYSSFWFV